MQSVDRDSRRGAISDALVYLSISLAAYLMLEAVTATFNLFEPATAAERRVYFSEMLRPDTRYGFALRPNLRDLEVSWSQDDVSQVVSTDSKGFRNSDLMYVDPTVAFLGDSFTFGAWVERDQTFVGLVGDALPGDALSFAVGGYGLHEYNLMYDDYVRALAPKNLLLMVFANDLNGLPSAFKTEFYASPDQMYYGEHSAWSRDAAYPAWHERLMTYRALKFFRQWWRNRDAPPDHAVASDSTLLFRARGTAVDYFYSGAREFVLAEIRKLIEKADRDGISLSVVTMPSRESAYRDEYVRLFADGAEYLAIEERGYAEICAMAALHLIPCLDLTPAFRARKGDLKLYFEIDGHWTPEGHRLAAETILAALPLMQGR